MGIKSPSCSIDTKGLIKVGKGTLIAAGGAGLVYLLEALPGVDFGAYTPIIVAVSAIFINFARKYLLSYK